MALYTIGVDFGTQSGRAVLCDVSDGHIAAEAEAEYPHGVMTETLAGSGASLPAGSALQDPDDYLAVLRAVLRDVTASAGISPASVIGIGIDCTCSTLLPVRRDGTPLCDEEKFRAAPHAYVKLWKHRAPTQAERFNAVISRRREPWAEHFGGKVTAEWIYAKIAQILEEAPEIYEETGYFLEIGDWLTWRLTGKLTRGYGFASFKAGYLPQLGGYPSEDFFAEADERLRHLIRDKMTAPVVMPGAPVGTVSAEAAEQFGLSAGTAVSSPMPDGHAPAIALGLCENGDTCAAIGTSSSYMMIYDRFVPVPGICGVVCGSPIPGFYGYSTGISCVGDLFSWAADRFQSEELTAECAARGTSPVALLTERAARKRPGETGLIALDWFSGNKCTLADSGLSGMILGLTLQTPPEDVLRALMEAAAFGTREIFETFAAHGLPVRRLIAVGGIPRKNAFAMQVFADILGMPVGVTGISQASALSSAIQAAAAAGEEAGGYADLRRAARAMAVRIERIYEPIPENRAVYDRLYAEYRRLFDYFGTENPVMKKLRALCAPRG